MFFNGWEPILRIVSIGVLSYLGLLFILRISGKRTLSKMNAYDLVVTVALGSILATILLDRNISLTEGLAAIFILVLMQYSFTWLAVRSSFFSKLIRSAPQLLYYDGQFLRHAMKTTRVLEVEILQAARSKGLQSLTEAEAVVLETDGSISVIKKSEAVNQSTLANSK